MCVKCTSVLFQAVYLLAGQASSRWKVGDVLCGNAPQDRHQVRDSSLPEVSQQLYTQKQRRQQVCETLHGILR